MGGGHSSGWPRPSSLATLNLQEGYSRGTGQGRALPPLPLVTAFGVLLAEAFDQVRWQELEARLSAGPPGASLRLVSPGNPSPLVPAWSFGSCTNEASRAARKPLMKMDGANGGPLDC